MTRDSDDMHAFKAPLRLDTVAPQCGHMSWEACACPRLRVRQLFFVTIGWKRRMVRAHNDNAGARRFR